MKNKRKTIHKTYKYLIVDYNMLKYEKSQWTFKTIVALNLFQISKRILTNNVAKYIFKSQKKTEDDGR